MKFKTSFFTASLTDKNSNKAVYVYYKTPLLNYSLKTVINKGVSLRYTTYRGQHNAVRHFCFLYTV